MKIRLFLIFVIAILMTACSINKQKHDFGKGIVIRSITDTLGVEKNSFKVRETFYIHFEVYNPSNQNIVFYTIPEEPSSIFQKNAVTFFPVLFHFLPLPVKMNFEVTSKTNFEEKKGVVHILTPMQREHSTIKMYFDKPGLYRICYIPTIINMEKYFRYNNLIHYDVAIM